MGFYGKYPWPSHPIDTQLAIGGTLLFVGNARVVVNVILSGVFDRHPDLQMVSVESGCGWIPFILEALDYEMSENAPDDLRKMKKLPSEYFRTNLYATLWFENNFNKLPRSRRHRGRGPDPLRDGLSAPHLPLPGSPRGCRGEDVAPVGRGPHEDPRWQCSQALPPLSRESGHSPLHPS